MVRSCASKLPVLNPSLQIDFHFRLQHLEKQFLHAALSAAIEAIGVEKIDQELREMAPAKALTRLAAFGLRGETVFPVPCLLAASPRLLGYYRLLFGLSQKEFYNKGPFGRFRRLEEANVVPAAIAPELPDLCSSLIATGGLLVEGVDTLSLGAVRDLQILTIGPQLRGRQNTVLGRNATDEVFSLIKGLVASHVIEEPTPRKLRIRNAADAIVVIEFASDPDIQVVQEMPSADRPLVSIEIKGGADNSNMHNRLGEAEKSHQKARSRGFFEFWTLHRFKVTPEIAHRESPTTSHFFHIDSIKNPATNDHERFADLLGSVVGIQVGSTSRGRKPRRKS